MAAIFERYQQELYGFCLGLLGEPQDAQDALQNTMVKVLRALPGEEREIALRPWLYRIARNEAVELRRSRHPTQSLEGHLVDSQASVIERAEQREHLQWLLKDLRDLPERQRTVLVMRELSGLDFAEIGAALDTSGAVVRQALYEARRNLQQMDHGRSLRCDAVTRVLSDADKRVTRRRDIRAHLRDCPDCRRFREAIGRRERVLGTIPPISLSAGAGAGVAQTLLGGSSSGGIVAAVTDGALKSAGAYGALKAAGTLAAVAVIGTAAIQGEMTSPTREAPPRHARAQVESPRSSQPRAKQAAAPGRANPSYRLADTAQQLPPTMVAARISDRRPRASLAKGDEFTFEPAARPADPPQPMAYVAHPPAADSEAGFIPGEGIEETPARGQEPEGEAAPPTPEPKDKPEPPDPPTHPKSAKAPPAAAAAPPRSESGPDHPQAPPGQARKQASAEPQAPSPAPPPPQETRPAAANPQSTQPGASPESNGKAKGHEQQSEVGPDRD